MTKKDESVILCPKCKGWMTLNQDNDLHCIQCGKIIVLVVRREYDSREGKIRDKKKESIRADMDRNSSVDGGGIRNPYSPNYHSKMVRQGGLFRLR